MMAASTHKRRRLTATALVLTAVAGISAMLIASSPQAARTEIGARDLNVVSSQGDVVLDLSAVDARALGRFARSGAELTAAALLSTRQGRSYYRIDNATGPACYGVGPAIPASYRLGQVQCAANFPSAERPLLDFTVIQQTTDDVSSARVVRSEGIAADGVADIAFVTANGEIVDVTPVKGNAYSADSLPAGHVTALIARDATGATLWTQPFAAAAIAKP
jgi:hypothetical protein